MYTAKNSGLLHFGGSILDTKYPPRVASKFVIEPGANHNTGKGAIHPGVAQWLFQLVLKVVLTHCISTCSTFYYSNMWVNMYHSTSTHAQYL